MTSRRTGAFTLPFALLVLLSLFNLATIAAPTGEDGVPLILVWASVVLGIAGLVAAVGLWQRRRWGMIAALVVLALTLLSAAPGLIEAPSTALRLAAGLTVALAAIALALLLTPSSRRAYA